MHDVTGNFPVKSVYTVPLVSADKKAINTFSYFSSDWGAISSSSGLLSLVVEVMFYCFLSRCPFAVAILGCKYLVTSGLFIPGHVTKWFRWIARSHVDLTGLNRAVCRNSMMAFFEFNCSRL